MHLEAAGHALIHIAISNCAACLRQSSNDGGIALGRASPVARAGATALGGSNLVLTRLCHLRAIPRTTPPVPHGQLWALLTA
jgi:hypothetical protein